MGEGFVGVCVDWGVLEKRCVVVNVYAKCDINAKRRLWENLLMSKQGFGNGLWCVVGDFNSVRRREDRRGVGLSTSSSLAVERREFDDFVEALFLEDLDPVGGYFTWVHPNGVTMSRLDRILVSDSWSSFWGDQILRVLPRVVSDHCPLLLKSRIVVSGPKPFRFCNHWLLHEGFEKVVEEGWRSNNFTGWMGFILKEKLKALKGIIKEWKKIEFDGMEVKLNLLVSNIRRLDDRGEVGMLSCEEVEERKRLFKELWELLRCKERLIFQRSRAKWLKEGDANSKYFHGCVKARQRRNSISCLKVEDRWLDSSTEIVEEVTSYFLNHFSSNPWERSKIDGVVFPLISVEDNNMLSNPFSLAEIEEVVKASDGNKSPGPDGFNFAFVKKFWRLMKGEVRIMFDQFHGNATLPKGMLSYFITLIPKVPSPLALGEFRPISLLGCLYKLIAKVLAGRLAKVMNSVVSNTQTAFIKGRHLVNGVVVINEVVDLAKKTGRPC
jgi:hypothetical protein